MTPGELYYYCPSCKRFHRYDNNKTVNRKLCFHCGKIKSKRVNIISDSDLGHTQICDACIEKLETM